MAPYIDSINSSAAIEESASDGMRSCSTSISSESASETGGHGERERVGESEEGTGETVTRRKW